MRYFELIILKSEYNDDFCRVIYANMKTRLVILRCRHGPHTLMSSSLPFVTKVRNRVIDKE